VKHSVPRSPSGPLQAQIAQFQTDPSEGQPLWERIHRTALGIACAEFHFTVADAEDIGQEMALRAFRHLSIHGFNYSWIRAGTRFLCIDRLRTIKAQERAAAGYEFTFESDRSKAELTADLTPAIARLPPTCRELIRRYYWDGMTWAEIDNLLNPGQRCSQYQMKKCLEELKARIREHEYLAQASRSLS
jgi:RNA polymerase sigma factor (sigma-70 family)